MLAPRRTPPPERRPRCEVYIGAGTARENETLFLRPGVPDPRDAVVGLPRPFFATRPITDYVESIRTVKSLDSPAGTFEIQTTFQTVEDVQRAALSRALAPNNLVQIRLDAGIPGSTMRPIMNGWVSHVGSQTTVSDNGRPQRQVTIRGYDAGKFLLRHSLPGHLLSGFLQGEGELAERVRHGLLVAGTPADVLHTIFEQAFAQLVPAPRAVWDTIQLLTDPALAGEGTDALVSHLVQENIWLRHGKFWNLLQSFSDPAWNELFGDYVLPPFQPAGADALAMSPFAGYRASRNPGATIESVLGGGYAIIARPRPFTEARWKALPTHEVLDTELRYEEAHRSDDERVNLVAVAPVGHTRGGSDQFFDSIVFQTVQFSRDEASRHGTHLLEAQTLYSDLGVGTHTDADELAKAAGGEGDMADALRERARRLWNWYSINPQLYRAVWVLAGTPDIQIGQRVQNQQTRSSSFVEAEYERRTYYVERVVQDYRDGSHFFTHLGLTRGQATGRFLEAPAPDENGGRVVP